VVLAVGKPTGWIADQLHLAGLVSDATAWLSPDPEVDPAASFANAAGRTADSDKAPGVAAEAFDPSALGLEPPPRRPLRTLLVTGDSLATPLDAQLARLLAPRHVRVIRDPHLGTGISKPFVVDWGQLSAIQVKRYHPDAVVMFVGADEGYPMPGPEGHDVDCCKAEWAAAYANRARTVADTFRRDGAANVYWVALPIPRDPDLERIARVVNAAVEVAVQPWRADVRVIETAPTFTPNGYRDAMPVNAHSTIVREADGVHLNEAGAQLLAQIVLREIARDREF
jgi:hypothetical protein